MNKQAYYFLCGLLMGIADTIPGISGGTIAFITGIYEKLLESIQAVDRQFFRYLFRFEISRALKKIPWSFVLPLLLGIGLAIFSLAHLVVYLMEAHLQRLWAFFFGLILASLFFLLGALRGQKGSNILSTLLFIVGTIFSAWLMLAKPIALSPTYPVLFFSGFIAICAMILPGISGAFLLVLLGQYQYILQAVADLNFPVLLVFVLGIVCGLLSFAHIVSACLKRYYKASLAFLTGILAGSMLMLFPFRERAFLFDFETAFLCVLIIIGAAIPLLLHAINQKLQR